MAVLAAVDLARAHKLAEEAVSALPRSAFAHYVKGQVLRAENRCEEAMPEYETAIAFNRNLIGAYAGLGGCKLATGSIDEVIPLQEQAIRLSPHDALIGVWYWRIGLANLLKSRLDEAIVWLEMARNVYPANPLHHIYLAAAYGLKGDTARAAAELGEARKLGADGRFSSIARLKASGIWRAPKIRALAEATYFVGLRKAGMPEK